ncbi:MAG: CotS family spore coat protein, partial [Lachnospiraceae bacterium]|nr:CotS family spore coat protein [Lachnospiraceae bacterium]
RFYQKEEEKRFICHGDYQYHNIIVAGDQMNLINFEKCVSESPVRDLYLFMRKLLEKSGWIESIGFELVDTYEKVRPIEKEEYRQLYYRLAYPEKFWKIVNFYYNSGKAWIPGKNLEKLNKVTEQEKDKQKFLEKFKSRYGI